MKEPRDLKEKILEIHDNPTLDEVWDLCVRNFLYDQERYVSEIEEIFNNIGITKDSQIVDLSAGGGFPALNLAGLGYKVDCFDGFSSDLFNHNAKLEGTNLKCNNKLWQELPGVVKDKTYDFAFCRGNSFIFAGGGWDIKKNVDISSAIDNYQRTMRVFANLLKDGGFMYIDKFKDSEMGHREKLATILVGGQSQDLVFSSERFPEQKIRQVFMDRVVDDQIVKRENRATYDLSEEELNMIMRRAGFGQINKLNFLEEKHFDVWLAKKE